jgi:hypothetical protein
MRICIPTLTTRLSKNQQPPPRSVITNSSPGQFVVWNTNWIKFVKKNEHYSITYLAMKISKMPCARSFENIVATSVEKAFTPTLTDR